MEKAFPYFVVAALLLTIVLACFTVAWKIDDEPPPGWTEVPCGYCDGSGWETLEPDDPLVLIGKYKAGDRIRCQCDGQPFYIED